MLIRKFGEAIILYPLLILMAATNGSNSPRRIEPVASEPVLQPVTEESVPDTQAPTIRLNAHAVKFVADYARKNGEDLELARRRSALCFTMMDSVLNMYGIPSELKYLAVVESNLDRKAVSQVGAVGPWQLMPTTAKILGLKIKRKYDERTYYAKSTEAAAIYLRDLHNEFHDWLLVVAAYNSGPGPVYTAIHKSGSRNFWKMQQYLPEETRAHVKRFIGTHYYFEGKGSVVTLTKSELNQFKKATAAYYEKKNMASKAKNKKGNGTENSVIISMLTGLMLKNEA
jgi:membrane-bound lytic murein transglycosylase D